MEAPPLENELRERLRPHTRRDNPEKADRSSKINIRNTADFILKVLGVYTRSMETIYLSLVHTGS